MEELIQQIQAKVNKKKVQSLCKKILKKLSFKSVRDLANVEPACKLALHLRVLR